MSERRQVWETLANMLASVESGLDVQTQNRAGASETLANEIRKLGKAQYKANILAETQTQKFEQTINDLRTTQDEGAKSIETLIEEREDATRRGLLEAILPALDSVENAMTSGKKYLAIRDKAATLPNPDVSRSILISPADRAMLSAWLDGLRLVQERLMTILESGGVTPIPTVGYSFDPYLHVAVERTSKAEKETAAGTIVAEERRGYRSEVGALRYAEVIVYRP
ncbi:MAG: nucleotide exchange factor GrpE [Chloroflexota bacterium]|nr:nucleotide exchange factor GrpE [Chloroflexota bacterium]